jgi:hypothetical protein
MYIPPVSEEFCVASVLKIILWWFSYWWQSSSSEDELLNIYRRRVPTSDAAADECTAQNNTPVGLSHDTTDTPGGPSPPPLVSTESTQKSSVGKQLSVHVCNR